MSIYISKNQQQLGPFEDNKVLEMIRGGQLSAQDLAIRQNERQWQTVGIMFHDHFAAPVHNQIPARAATLPMKKKRTGGLYAISLALLIVGQAIAIFIFAITTEVKSGSNAEPFLALGIGVAILAFLQFLVVHMVTFYYLLYKMWSSIQDGVSTTTASAIGFLFIPIFNIYWIFKAWGGFPTEYNKYIERHQLNVPSLPSSVYPLVPIFALLSVFVIPIIAIPFIFLSAISQTCDAVNHLNQGLENKAGGNDDSVVLESEPLLTGRWRATVFGLGGGAVCALIVLIGIGWWNMNPKPSQGDLPNMVLNFSKTNDLDHRGSIFGKYKEFRAMYETPDNKKAVFYEVIDVRNSFISSYGAALTGDISDASGNKVGEYAVRKDRVEILKGRKKMQIVDLSQNSYYLSIYGQNKMARERTFTALTPKEMLELAKALLKNSQLTFTISPPKTN